MQKLKKLEKKLKKLEKKLNATVKGLLKEQEGQKLKKDFILISEKLQKVEFEMEFFKNEVWREKFLMLNEMFILQNKLNCETNGNKWRHGYAKNNKKIDWYRCIYMEGAEAIDSFPWKHWKDVKKEIDIDNLKIEIVDIWHFIMSEYIRKYYDNEYKKIEFIAAEFFEEYPALKIDRAKKIDYSVEEKLKSLEILLESALQKDLEKIIRSFIHIMNIFDIDMESLYKLYIGKNVLNKFRQDNGYQEGTYNKVWNGEEDNVYMQNILDSFNGVIEFDEIYQQLHNIYGEIEKND